MSPTFASLSIRNYRIYALGAIVSNVGTWMGRVAQDWVVLTELTDHSATALGIVTGLQFLPMLLLAPWTGAVTDRYPGAEAVVAALSAGADQGLTAVGEFDLTELINAVTEAIRRGEIAPEQAQRSA